MISQNLLDISLGQIEIFLSVAEKGNFSRAAEQLGITQSAVSKTIQKIERVLGFPLFIREYHALMLTEEARLLADRWKEDLKNIDRAYSEANGASQIKQLFLLIGVPQNMNLDTRFWPMIDRFSQAHPEIRISFDSDIPSHLAEKLQNDEIDLFLGPYFSKYSIEQTPSRWKGMSQSCAQVILPLNHPLGAKEQLSMEDIKNETLAYVSDPHDDNKRWLESLFTKQGYTVKWGRCFESPNQISKFFRRTSSDICITGEEFRFDDLTISMKPLIDVENGIILAWKTPVRKSAVRIFVKEAYM